MSSTTPRSPPFRAEHLGSLLRPKELLTKRNAFEAGKVSQSELSPVEDEAIKTTVKMQTDLGFRAISDGEYRYVFLNSCNKLLTTFHAVDIPMILNHSCWYSLTFAQPGRLLGDILRGTGRHDRNPDAINGHLPPLCARRCRLHRKGRSTWPILPLHRQDSTHWEKHHPPILRVPEDPRAQGTMGRDQGHAHLTFMVSLAVQGRQSLSQGRIPKRRSVLPGRLRRVQDRAGHPIRRGSSEHPDRRPTICL